MKRFILTGSVILMTIFMTSLGAQRSTNPDKPNKETKQEKTEKADKGLSLGSILEKITESISENSGGNHRVRASRQKSSGQPQAEQEKPVQKEDNRSSRVYDRQTESGSDRTSSNYYNEKPVKDNYQQRQNSNQFHPEHYYKQQDNQNNSRSTYQSPTVKPTTNTNNKPNQSNRTQSVRTEQNSHSQFIYEKPQVVKETRTVHQVTADRPQSEQIKPKKLLANAAESPSVSNPQRIVERHGPTANRPPYVKPDEDGHHPPDGDGHSGHHGDGDSDHNGDHHDNHNDHFGWDDYDHHDNHHHDNHHNDTNWHFYFDFSWHPYYAWADNYYYWDDWDYYYYDGWNGYYTWGGYYPYYPYYDYYHHRHYRYVAPVFVYHYRWDNEVETFRGYLVRKTPHSNTHDNNGWLSDEDQDTDSEGSYSTVYCNIRGYGIVTRQSNGERAFYHFDRYGNRTAKELWVQYGRNNQRVFVQIRGILDPDTHTIKVFSMRKISRYHSANLALQLHGGWWNNRPYHRI